MTKTVAILIPTKNRSSLLSRAVESVISQTVLPDELIIVNDGSTDDTKGYLNEIALKYTWIKVIHCSKSGGVNTARNIGIRNSESHWIAFLDDDDEFFKNAIEVIKRKIRSDESEVDILYFNTEIHRDNHKFIGGFQFDRLDIKYDHFDPSYKQTMVKFNLLGDCKQVIRKSVFNDQKFLFPESVNGFESFTMCLMAREGIRIRYYREVLTIIHQESSINGRLSINASKKNPAPLLFLHFMQIFQHSSFYFSEPILMIKKIIVIIKLSIRSIFVNFKNFLGH